MARCFTSEYTRILLSLSSLVSLKLIESQGRVPLLGSSSRVARAVVILDGKCSDECSKGWFDDCGDICNGCYYYYGDPDFGPGYDRNSSTFLHGLSQATDLELTADSDVVCFPLLLS